MLRVLGLLTATALLIFTGIVHGLWTNRWGSSEELTTAVANLDKVSLTLGDWEGQPVAMDERDKVVAGGEGYLMRRYKNRHTGAEVSVFLVCGRPGPVSVHTPEVCYDGSGYRRAGGTHKHSVVAAALKQPAEFNWALFQKEGATARDQLRTFWGWYARGTWQAPANPRPTFARLPALFKLYVIRQLAGGDEPVAEDPCIDFLKLLLPELDRKVFAAGL